MSIANRETPISGSVSAPTSGKSSSSALRLIQWSNKVIRTGIRFPLMFQILHEVALCPCLQERDVAREKTRGPGGLLSRQTAEKPQAERQRASRESKSSERRALPLSIGPCARPGLMRLEIRLQTEQVCDRKPFGPKSRSIETRFVDSEWGIQFKFRFFVYSLFSSRHGGSLFNSLSLWGGRAGGTVPRSGGTIYPSVQSSAVQSDSTSDMSTTKRRFPFSITKD